MTIEDYIISHSTAESPLLQELRDATWRTRLYPRMCSSPLRTRLLAALVMMIRPKRVLEIGTFTGCSALAMAEALDDDARLHTIEIDDESEPFIRRWLDTSPHGKKVTLHIGNALEVVPTLSETWDMALVDGNKRHYCEYLDMLVPRMAHGGWIIADNTLWGDKLLDPEARDAQTLGIRRFNDRVSSDPRLFTVMLPLDDGVTLIRVNA